MKFGPAPVRLALLALLCMAFQFAIASAPVTIPAPAPAPKTAPSSSGLVFDRYHTPAELNAALLDLARANPAFARTHSLAKTPGGRELILLEIGPETAIQAARPTPAPRPNPAAPPAPSSPAKTLPAVFIASNMEGTVPLSSEAALYLATLLLQKPDLRSDRTWYILPCGKSIGICFSAAPACGHRFASILPSNHREEA